MVIVIWEQWKDNIFHHFSTPYNEKILTDVVIQVGKKKCEVHSFVISLFSRFFQDLLEIARKDDECEIPINIIFTDLNFEAVSTIISFMYFGEMTVEDDLIPEVLYLSRLLQIKGLEDLQAYFVESVATDTEPTSVCIENSKCIYGLDVDFDEQSSVEEILKNKKILADITPLRKPSEDDDMNIIKLEENYEYADEREGDPCSNNEEEIEENSSKELKKKSKKENILRKKVDKMNKRSTVRKKLPIDKENIEMLHIKSMKKHLLEEVDKCLMGGAKDSWPLDEPGIEILHEMNETFCGKLKINKGSELLDDTKNPVKISKNRFRREMSYFWHQLLALSNEERRRFIMNIPDKTIKDIYKMILKEKTVIDILKELLVNTAEMSCCIFILLIAGHLSLKLVIWAYKVEDTYLLYKERIEKAISLYQTTDLFLIDITEQCWVPYTSVKEEIEKLNIERIDGFDAAVQNALRLCGGGLSVEQVLSMDDIAQYSEDFKHILEHHMGRDIVLPLRPYEERINLALAAAWEEKAMTMMKAAQEFIVSYSTLCKRALSREDKEAAFTPKSPSDKKRTKLFYRGKAEPVISSSRTRRGQKSKTDTIIRAALLSCKEGMTPEEAFKVYNIKNSRTKNMIRFNVNRKDAPLGKSYTTRFKNAIDEVNINKKTINEASKLHLINYSALREWFYVKNTNKKIPKRSAKNRKKPRFEDQIEAAIHSVRSGMSVLEAFNLHSMKDKKNLNILKYNAEREDAPLHIDYETRLNMAIKAVRNFEMSCTDAGREFCVNSSTLRYYEHEGFKVPSKGVHNFEEQMKAAISVCREGMSVADACTKFNIKTPKYQKILEFNLQRSDPPLDEPYANRMQKAKDAIFNAEMTISEASEIYMVSPAVLSKHFNRAKKTNTIPKPLNQYDSLSNKFDARMIDAIKCCRQGMSIGKSFKQNRLRSERSLECLKYNAKREDAPLDVPYHERMNAAVAAVMNGEMKITHASRHFIVSPFTLEKTWRAMATVGRLRKKENVHTSDSGTITVIPEPDSPDKSLVQVIKQEIGDDFGIEIFNEMEEETRVAIENVRQKEKENDQTISEAISQMEDQFGDQHVTKSDGEDKAIKIQILRRYSKGNTHDNNKGFVGSSTKKRKYKPYNERKGSVPVTAYQQRLQLALEACMTMKMRKGEAARRFQVNLGELNDVYEKEWLLMFGPSAQIEQESE